MSTTPTPSHRRQPRSRSCPSSGTESAYSAPTSGTGGDASGFASSATARDEKYQMPTAVAMSPTAATHSERAPGTAPHHNKNEAALADFMNRSGQRTAEK